MTYLIESLNTNPLKWQKWGADKSTLDEAVKVVNKAKKEGYINQFRITEINPYTDEDLQTDINWLIDQGVEESEAEPFIKNLLNKRMIDEN